MQDLLQNWLPGGITGVYVISLRPEEQEFANKTLGPHFHNLIHIDGYKPKIKSLGDYNDLPIPVSDRTKMHIHAKEGQSHHRDIASFGGIGCAISHILLWKKVAASSGWSIIFEWDCVLNAKSVDMVADFTKEKAPDDNVSMLRLVYNHPNKTNEKSIPGNKWFVKDRTHLFGTTMCVVANAWAGALYNYFSRSIDVHIDQALNLASYTGATPSTWFLRKNLGIPSSHKSTTCANLSLKKWLPCSTSQSNAIILAVLLSLFLTFTLAVVFIVLYATYRNK
jgi:GR25 family glycosyltransferase involved in LPS biosynthesis